MEIVHKVILDFARNDYTEIEVTKSKDRTVVLEMYLLNHGDEVDLSTVAMATIKGETANGNKVFAEAEVLTDCVRYELSKAILGTEGKTTCTLQVTDQGADTSNAFVFYVNVLTNLFDEDDYVGEDDITAVRACMIRAENAAKSSEADAAAVEVQKESLQNLTKTTEETLSDCNEYMDNLKQRVESGEFNGSQGIQGPQGEQGIQGPRGEQGEKGATGESGYMAPVNGIYSLSVEPETGDVYVEYPDEEEEPKFELEENGDVYIVTQDDRVYVGKVDLSGYVKDIDVSEMKYSEIKALYDAGESLYIIKDGERYVCGGYWTSMQYIVFSRIYWEGPLTRFQFTGYYISSSSGFTKIGTEYYLKPADVIDSLVSNVPNKPLSANQGRVLKELIESGGKKYAIVNEFTTAEEFENCITNNIPMYYEATIDTPEFADTYGYDHYLLPYITSYDEVYIFGITIDMYNLSAAFNEQGNNEWSFLTTQLATPEDIPTKMSHLEQDVELGAGSDTFVAEYGVTTFNELQAAHNKGKHIIVKYPYDIMTTLYVGLTTHQLGVLYTFTNVHLGVGNSKINHNTFLKISCLYTSDGQGEWTVDEAEGFETFTATYGTTTYAAILREYQANKGIILNVPGAQVGNGLMDLSMTLARVDNNNDNSTGRYTFTFSTDENGISHYASINYDTQTWNYWTYNYVLNITRHDEAIVSLINQVADLRKFSTVYKREEIPANGRYQLRESGFYIFGGSDYDLNLCRANGDTVGKTKSLVVIVFCTEADETGAFRVYVMQNYKSIGVPSMDGMPYDGLTRDCYIHNTNGSAGAYVYYMRQNEV